VAKKIESSHHRSFFIVFKKLHLKRRLSLSATSWFGSVMASETASAEAGVDGYEAGASELDEDRLESGTLRFTVVAPDGAKLPIEVAVSPLMERHSETSCFSFQTTIVRFRQIDT